jgi:acetolactate synthase-1/2/3 large subunit
VSVERIPYPVDQAVGVLAPFRHLILIGAKTPVAFFAYPNKPSLLAAPEAQIHPVARREDDVLHALAWLADELGARNEPFATAPYAPPAPATGKVTPESLAKSIGAALPENAIVVDEGVSTGRGFFPSTRGAPPHDWLQNMGGSIGIGPPLAVGAAIACPGRKVLNLEGDGSAMYTVQALWTQARENLDVTTVIFANRSYAILRYELSQVGAQNVGRKALDMLDLGRPDLDWISLARGMGVPGARVDNMEDFNKRLAEGLATPGPFLIEVLI